MREVPVYIFTGFMDSGKTTLVKETVFSEDFQISGPSLIICCEEGDVEYDLEELKKHNISLEMVEEESGYTAEFLQEMQKKYHPHQVFIEFNGTWDAKTLLETPIPRSWVLAQSISTVDASTFDLYLTNMRTMILSQMVESDLIIFNRCNDTTDRGKFRRAVKAQNRKGQIVYEKEDGTIDDRPIDLPFDISGKELEISEADYAIWFLDCQENPKKYEGKIVSFQALIYNPANLRKGIMIPGRFAMTCCEADITFFGLACKYDQEDKIPHKSWVNLKAEIHVEYSKEYEDVGPVLYALSAEPCEAPKDELVYVS